MNNQILKKIAPLALSLIAMRSEAQITSTFEEKELAPASFWNGSDKTGSFESGEAIFNNSYNAEWDSWSGFALSNMTDVTTEGLKNQYSSYAGSGADGSSQYAVAYLDFYRNALQWKPISKGTKLKSIAISNATYTALDMKNGSRFSKKFGGLSGNDPDFLKLYIINYSSTKPDTISVTLADYTFADNSKDYILDQWTTIDLSKFKYSDSLQFKLVSSDNGEFGMNTPAYFCVDNLTLIPAPFAAPAKQANTTAIFKDSSIFVSWASNATIQRGYRDVSLPIAGFAEVGTELSALGKAGNNGIVSLGDGGMATLSFDRLITNGKGFDFAIFENSFNSNFLELAFVEVSSDGENFFRFPSTSYSDTSSQTDAFGNTDARMINNLAGKYEADYGTPFDLEELKNIEGLDIDAISHIRIVDVVGSINAEYGTRDQNGKLINDPWPTNFGSSGFDLDAVGVIHQAPNSLFSKVNLTKSNAAYPNPANINSKLYLYNTSTQTYVRINDATGTVVYEGKGNEISLEGIQAGLYMLHIQTEMGKSIEKLVIK